MCQSFKKFLDISIKEISVESNTIDYAVLFTEENLIQVENDLNVEVNFAAIRERQNSIANQWADLTDYYQLLNEPDLVEAVIL